MTTHKYIKVRGHVYRLADITSVADHVDTLTWLLSQLKSQEVHQISLRLWKQLPVDAFPKNDDGAKRDEVAELASEAEIA